MGDDVNDDERIREALEELRREAGQAGLSVGWQESGEVDLYQIKRMIAVAKRVKATPERESSGDAEDVSWVEDVGLPDPWSQATMNDHERESAEE